MSKNILVLDTALNGCVVGLKTKDQKTYVREERMVRGQAERLIPMMEACFEEAKISTKELDHVFSTIGPGTFTGLRLALSATKTLSASLKIKAYGVTTFDLLSCQFSPSKNHAVVLETKRKDFYIQCFDAEGEKMSEPLALLGEPSSQILIDHKVEVVISDCKDRLHPFLNQAYHFHDVSLPSGEAFLKFAEHVLETQSSVLKPLEPMYLRDADVSQSKKKQRILSTAS